MNAKAITLTLPIQVSLQFEYENAFSKNSALTNLDFEAFSSQDVSTSLVEEKPKTLISSERVTQMAVEISSL